MTILNHRNGEDYQNIFENANEGIFQSSLEGRFLKVNPAMARIYGYDSPEDMLASVKNIGQQIYVNAKDREVFLKEVQTTGSVDKFEGKNYRKDGSIFWTQTNARIVRDAQGNALFIEGFTTDITSRKQTALRLKRSEEQFKRIFQSNPIASCIATLKEGCFIAANDAYWELSGYNPDEIIGHTGIELGFVKPEERKSLVGRLKNEKSLRIEGGKFITKDGDIRKTLKFFELINFDGQDCILSMFYDITDQVKTQKALLENEEKYRQLFEAESDAIFLIDNETGKILEVNAAAMAMYGYSKEELLRKKNSDLSAEPEETHKVTTNTPINETQVISIPLRFHRKKDGTVFPVEITGRFFEWRGRFVHIAAIRDITERRQVEKALRESEQNFRNIVEHTTNIYYSHTPDHVLTFMSQKTREILGYEPEEALINWHDFLTDNPINQEGVELTQKAIETGKPQKPYILELKRKDGQKVWVEVHESPILKDGKTVSIVGALTDITKRIHAEDTLKHQLEELTILHNIAITASSSKSLDELIKRTTDIIYDALHPDNCGVELVTEAGDMYQAHSSYRGASKNENRKSLPISEGIVGKVISSDKPIRLGDVSKDSAYIEVTRGIESELCVPIKIQERVIGALNLESRRKDAYTESDERLLNTIARTLATAIEQLRHFESSQHHLQELTILNAVSLACTRANSLDDLIESVTQIIGESLYPDNFGVLLLNKEGTALMPHPSYRGISRGKFPKILSIGQGVSGQVAASGNPMRIANVRTHDEYIEVTSQVRSELCVPIKLTDRILGVINAESVQINAFTEDDEQLLSTIASTLATAMEKIRLLEEEKRRRWEAEALRETTAALTTSIELEALYEIIIDSVTKLVPCDSASIEILKEGYLKVVYGRNLKGNKICVGEQYPFDAKKWDTEAFKGPIIIPNVQEDDRFEKHEGTEYIRGWMGVPMVVQNRLVGFLNFDSTVENFFTSEHSSLAHTFGNQAAIAIENARLFQEETRRSQIIEAMANITNEFATAHEIIPALEKITLHSLKLLNASTVAIYLLQDDNKTIKVATAMGAYREQLSSHTLQIGKGITGNIIETGKPEIVDDMLNDPRRITVPGTPREDAQSDTIMSAPLILRGKPIGAINAWRRRSNGLFNESELNFLVSIANQTSMLIESIRLFQETARHAQEAHAIAEVGRDISSTLQLDIVLERIAQYAMELLKAETSAVYLTNRENSLLRAIAAFGKESREIKNDPLPLGSGILGDIALQKSGEIVNNSIEDSRAIIVKGTECHPNEHLMGVPVLSKDQLTGLLAVWRTGEGEEFKSHELDFLDSLAQQAAVAIENARLFEGEQRRLRESETLRQAALAVTTTLELESVLDTILIVMKQVVPYDSASVLMVEGDQLKLTAAQGFSNKEEILNLSFPADDELLETVQNSQEPVILKNAQLDKRFNNWADTDYVRGWMGVPLIIRNEVIGYITFDSHQEDVYNETFASLTQAFAYQAASAIQNARQFETEQRHFQEAETLRQAAEAITSTLDIQQVLASILDNLNRVIPFDSASVFLIENENVRLTAAKGFLINDNSVDRLFPASDTLLQEISRTRQPLILKDAQNESRFKKWIVDQVHGWIGVPLIARGIIIGYITIDSQEVDAYTEHDANLAMTFAHQAAVAIENARLYERGEAQIRRLTVLRDIDSAISSSFDLRVTLNLLIGYAAKELGTDAAAILLYNSDLKSLSLYTNTGFTKKHNFSSSHIRIGEGLAGRVVLQRKLVNIADLGNTTEYTPSSYFKDENFKGYFGVPLIAKGQIKGVMELYTREEFNPDLDWQNFLYTLAGQAAIAIDNVQLFKNLQRSNQELILAYDTTLAGWGRALELRDKETQGHTDRVVEMTIELARRMGIEGEELTHIMRGTLLHDIGKMGIPDHILHKPGPLTEEEWDIMRKHPTYAYELIHPIPYLRPTLDIPYAHHERWDGSGYPRGLKGENIPLAARIFAVVDIWDALLNKRVYREAWPDEKVFEYLKNAAGIEIDPDIVDIFLEMLQEDRFKKQAE